MKRLLCATLTAAVVLGFCSSILLADDPPEGVPEGWRDIEAKDRAALLARLLSEENTAAVDYLLEQYAAISTTAREVLYLHSTAVARKGIDEANQWISGLLLSSCQEDLAQCPVRAATWAAQVMYLADKKVEGLAVLNAAGERAATIEDVFYLQEEGKRYKGDDVDAWLLGILEAKCKDELAKCDLGLSNFAVDLLCRNGKTNEATEVLDAASQRAATVKDCFKIRQAAGLVHGENANGWLAGVLVSRCSDDIADCEPDDAAWAAGVLAAGGKTESAQTALTAAVANVKTIQDCSKFVEIAKTIYGDQADSWLAGVILEQCQDDLSQCSIGLVNWAAMVLAKDGKAEEATQALQQGANRVSTVAECMILAQAASQIHGDSANTWLAGVLTSRCQNDFDRCALHEGNWAVIVMSNAGQKTEAKAVLDKLISRIDKVSECAFLRDAAFHVLGSDAEQYLAESLVSRCQADMAECPAGEVIWAVDRLLAGGGDEAAVKALMESASRRIENLDVCLRFDGAARKILEDNADAWLSGIIKELLDTNLASCSQDTALWAARVLQRAGRQEDSSRVMVALAGKAESIAQCRQAEAGVRAIRPGRLADMWLANVILTSCQEELANCGVADAAWVAKIYAASDRRDDAIAILQGIESGEMAFKESLNEEFYELSAVSIAWHAIGGFPDKAKAAAMDAMNLVVGEEDARSQINWQTLLAAADLFDKVGLTGKGTGYESYAQAIVSVACRGEMEEATVCDSTCASMGNLLLSPASQNILKDNLLDPEGNPYEGLAKVLAWANAYSATPDEWIAFLDSRIESSQGDTKARWLLARAYAEATSMGDLFNMQGMPWMNRALTAAQSSQARLWVVDRIVSVYSYEIMEKEGLSFLDSVASQFASDTQSAETFTGIRSRFIQGIRDNKALKESVEAEQELRKKNSLKIAIKSRMALAQERGDTVTVNECQAALEAID